jgi:hypothetical protein
MKNKLKIRQTQKFYIDAILDRYICHIPDKKMTKEVQFRRSELFIISFAFFKLFLALL